MRPKFVLALVLVVLVVLGVAFLLKQHWGNAATPPAVNESVTPAPVASVAPPPAPTPAPVAARVDTNVLTSEQRQEAIEAETDRLQQWSMNDDAASLSNILDDLTSSDKEIREAAIDAAKQFGSTNAIPALKAAANSTDDTQEKIDLLEAADFLALPGMTFDSSGAGTPRTPEQIQADAQRRAEREARRQAQLQRRQGNQNSQSNPGQTSSGAIDN